MSSFEDGYNNSSFKEDERYSRNFEWEQSEYRRGQQERHRVECEKTADSWIYSDTKPNENIRTFVQASGEALKGFIKASVFEKTLIILVLEILFGSAVLGSINPHSNHHPGFIALGLLTVGTIIYFHIFGEKRKNVFVCLSIIAIISFIDYKILSYATDKWHEEREYRYR